MVVDRMMAMDLKVDSIQEQLVMSASRADVLEPPLAGKVPRHAAIGTVTGL
jgi:hypothetical protein